MPACRSSTASCSLARQARERAEELIEKARAGSVWSTTWEEVRRVLADGVERIIAGRDEGERRVAAGEVAAQAERVARGVVEYALKGVRAAEDVREEADAALREAERRRAEAGEQQDRTEWLIEQRRAASQQGPLAVRRAKLQGELDAERRQAEHMARERAERLGRAERLRAQHAADTALLPLATRLAAALADAAEAVEQRIVAFEEELARDHAAGEEMAGELRECAGQEAEIQARLRGAGEVVTAAEVAAQRLRDQAGEAELEVSEHRIAAGPRCRGAAQRPWMRSRRRPCAPAWSAWSAGASSSARSTRWRSRSTPRPWRTSRRWRGAAPTSRRRCASCAP